MNLLSQDKKQTLVQRHFSEVLRKNLPLELIYCLSEYCVDNNIISNEIFDHAKKLIEKGYNEKDVFVMIKDCCERGAPLSSLDKNPNGLITPNYFVLNQPVQIGRGPNGETFSRVMNPAVAGISFQQAQSENYEQMKDERELLRRQQEIDQDLYKQRRQNEEEERHIMKMIELKRNENTVQISTNPFVSQTAPEGTGFNTGNLTHLDYAAIFVAKKHVVREKKRRDSDTVVLYMWDDEEHLYSKISQKQLTATLKSFWPENLVENNTAIERLANTIRYKLAPELDNSELHIADGNQTFFPNGYFDIKSGHFCPCDTSAWFHNFCFTYDYDENAPNPEYFDQILGQIFEYDETKVKLAYQIIGALISEVRSLKEIYVFQGVTNSGKTTLASIILKLLHKSERKKLNSVKEITDDTIKNLSKSIKVLCIKDSGQEALKVNSVSYLKSYASGDFDEDEIYFTMLLQTNNPIYSDKFGKIEKALHDRFLVLPFAKDMKTAHVDNQVDPIQDFIDCHFETEKYGIVKKALCALHEVMAHRKRFVYRFPLNGCVGETVSGLPTESENRSSEVSSVTDKKNILKNFIEDHFDVIEPTVFQANPIEGIPAQHLVTLVSKNFPHVFGNANANSLGKILTQIKIFDQLVETRDFENKRYYNLRLIIDSD